MTCEYCAVNSGIFDFSRDCCAERHDRTMRPVGEAAARFLAAAKASAGGDHRLALEFIKDRPGIADSLRRLVKHMRNK